MTRHIFIFVIIAMSFCAASAQELRGKLVQAPAVCEAGYEKGVSSQFYALSPEGIVVAGGANFPDIPASEGGKKVFYKGVYLLRNDEWLKIDELYSATAFEAYIITAGINMMTTNGLQKSSLVHYDHPDTLPLNHQSSFAEKLLQPVMVADSNNIYVWGGFSLPASVPIGGWKLNLKTNCWQKIATPPTKNLTGATITPYKDGYLVVGGVNYKIFQSALGRRENMTKAQGAILERLKLEEVLYMKMAPSKYQFNDKLLFYDPSTDKWKSLGHSRHLARAGAAAVVDNLGRLIVTGGEEKPGIRNPTTWIFDLNSLR